MRSTSVALGRALWLLSGAFAGAAWGWAAMRVLYRFFDVDSAGAALAGGVIFGLAVALGLWYLGWREVRG